MNFLEKCKKTTVKNCSVLYQFDFTPQVKSTIDDTAIPVVKLALAAWGKVSRHLPLAKREDQEGKTKGTFFNDIATEFHLLFVAILKSPDAASAAVQQTINAQTRRELKDAASAALEAMSRLGTEETTCVLFRERLHKIET